jgi:hypothetical protein
VEAWVSIFMIKQRKAESKRRLPEVEVEAI